MSQILTHVVNTITSAVTSFEGYPYNSFARFQGRYLGAGPGGLFQLDDAASTETVTGTLTTGQLKFGSEMQKRLSDFYLGMRSEGDITLSVTVDELPSYDYSLSPHNVATLSQRRTLIGKGLKGKYWQFSLVCADTFDYDTMNIAAVPVSRRV